MPGNEIAEQMLRRQLIAFSQFTSRSLSDRNIEALMLDACLRSRAGLAMTHAKLLEYLPDRDRLLLRSGVGWKAGYVGQYEISADVGTPIGHAFLLSEPVAVSDYTGDALYSYPAILKEHGCLASLNVPLRTDDGNFGVLEVDDTSVRMFSADDINFLTGLGNTIARAIELRRALHAAEAALDQKQLLFREMNHRIKNNLSLVAAILNLQARQSADTAVRDALASAVTRINNMALVHDRLQLFSSSATEVNAASHFQYLCDMLRSLLPPGISLVPRCSGSIAGDNVEALTLIANELITNAAKHAFNGREAGEIILGYRESGAAWSLWVRDNGTGRSTNFACDAASFGTRLVEALAARLDVQLVVKSKGGTTVELAHGLKADSQEVDR